jgi:sugar/nucleoside kinase (ribokinase family)
VSQNIVDVSSIGTLAVDYFGIVSRVPDLDEKTMAERYEIHPGGVAGNVITQAARLGVSAGWIGKIGEDPTGEILGREFEKDGIDTSHMEVVGGKNSMFTWILVDKRGSRTITMFPNVLNEFTAEDVEAKHADYIRSSKVLMAEACVLPLSPVIRAMEIAKEAGVTVIFDLDVTPTGVEEMNMGTRKDLQRALSLADVFIPCKAAAVELLGSDQIVPNMERLRQYGANTVAVTLGEHGCVIAGQDQLVEVPGFPVEVVDTTGAGDAFHGGFVYGFLQGMEPEQLGRFANACGAVCCTKVGARSSGTLPEVQALIDSQNRLG